MTDMQLLRAAAIAADIELGQWFIHAQAYHRADRDTGVFWNPLTDDGDALRLAVKLEIDLQVRTASLKVSTSAPEGHWIHEPSADLLAATRRAIVRAAAAMAPKEKT